jgi:mannose-1-phosphate guanylyltransferase
MGWSDIGCWLEFGNLQPQEGENRIMGETVLSDVKNCTIYSQHRLIAALGIEDLIIADTEDALLVAHKNHTQNVRDIVEKLKSRDDARYKTFPKSAQSEGMKNRNEETPLHFNQTKILQE